MYSAPTMGSAPPMYSAPTMGSQLQSAPTLGSAQSQLGSAQSQLGSAQSESGSVQTFASAQGSVQTFASAQGSSQSGNDLVSDKYVLGDIIGKGAYGSVTRARDITTGIMYAVKIVSPGGAMYSPDSIIEISVLMLLKDAVNVVSIKDISLRLGASAGTDNFHPAIILPLYDSNSLKHSPENSDQLKSAMFDICNGMLSLYNKNIFHLDLKPENILWKGGFGRYGRYFITDFGISLKVLTSRKQKHDCSVQTLWYRSPEVALSNACGRPCIYDYTTDLWSLGIIMGEFSGKMSTPPWDHPIIKYLRVRGDSTDQDYNLLSIIYKIFGKTSIDPDIISCQKISDIRLPYVPFVSVHTSFPTMNGEEFDFMMTLLKLNPLERPEYQEIFSHSYFNGYMPTEPTDMSSINKVKSIDSLNIHPLNYSNQNGVDLAMRTILVDWILKLVQDENCLESFFLSIMILDQYMHLVPNILRSKFQLIGVSCVVIASLITENSKPLTPNRAQQATLNTYTIDEINTTAFDILKLFNYSLGFSTEKDYIDAYLDTNDIQEPERSRVRIGLNLQLARAAKNEHFKIGPKK